MGIYLDNSATTRPLGKVVEAVSETLKEVFGNPSSDHAVGWIAKSSLALARNRVAEFVMTDPECIIFVSGATEANDIVLRHAFVNTSRQLITTEAEHSSTHGVFASSLDRMTFVPTTRSGEIDTDYLYKTMETMPGALLAIGWVNGETGVIQPVKQICQVARQLKVTTLIDAAQALGRVPVQDFDFEYDYMSSSAHKMHGPKGVGCLVLGKDVKSSILPNVGTQERGLRPGTENLPGIVGFGVACAERIKTMNIDLERLGAMRDKLERILIESDLGAQINGEHAKRVPSNTNIMFRGIDGMALVARCDSAGVQLSQVSACSSGTPDPSKTLKSMGLNEDEAYSSVRLSLSVLNTDEEIEKATEIISREVRSIRRLLRQAA